MRKTTDNGSTPTKSTKTQKLDAASYLKSKKIVLKSEPSLDDKDAVLHAIRVIVETEGAVEAAKVVRSIHSLTSDYDIICDEVVYDLLDDQLFEVKGGRYEPLIKVNGVKQAPTASGTRDYARKIECLLRGDLDYRLRKAMYYMPGYVDCREGGENE